MSPRVSGGGLGAARRAIVVFSGGQDSTTCLYWAIRKFGRRNIVTVTFDYGQRHRIELRAARKIARLAGVPHRVIPINTFKHLGPNALTGKGAIRVPKKGLPTTFVPGRNLIFLTYAAAYAYSLKARHLVGGMCQTDFSGYPDCRDNTLRALEKAIRLGMESPLRIHTPLMFKTKAESVRMAQRLNAFPALALSHTCYNGKFPPCGKCPACKLRAKSFREAGVEDPLTARGG